MNEDPTLQVLLVFPPTSEPTQHYAQLARFSTPDDSPAFARLTNGEWIMVAREDITSTQRVDDRQWIATHSWFGANEVGEQ